MNSPVKFVTLCGCSQIQKMDVGWRTSNFQETLQLPMYDPETHIANLQALTKECPDTKTRVFQFDFKQTSNVLVYREIAR